MTFNKSIAVLAMLSLVVQANAQDAQMAPAAQPVQGVIILNSTNATTQQQPVQQPATVVEGTAVVESKAEAFRKARQNAEMATEAKIVEKLEESRLKEEQERAQRLFGDKLDTPAQQAAPVQQVVVPAQQPVEAEQKATNVTIEKVEIVQPAPVQPQTVIQAPVITSVKEDTGSEDKAAGQSKLELAEESEDTSSNIGKLWIGGVLGGINYDASNVDSNGALGFTVGSMMSEKLMLEGFFIYSDHDVDTFWQPGLYREMEQYDLGVNAKYYILSGRLQPYVGGGIAYIYRLYQDRVTNSQNFGINNFTTEEDTHSVNLSIVAGVDFLVNNSLAIGAGVDYSTNLFTRADFDEYGLPSENAKALEEVDFFTLKLNAKFSF